MAKYLVIVESPAKVKTIKKFLGNNYEVAASNGHVYNDKDKKLLCSCDAYYGDTSPVVQEYRNNGKPVMIMDYMV